MNNWMNQLYSTICTECKWLTNFNPATSLKSSFPSSKALLSLGRSMLATVCPGSLSRWRRLWKHPKAGASTMVIDEIGGFVVLDMFPVQPICLMNFDVWTIHKAKLPMPKCCVFFKSTIHYRFWVSNSLRSGGAGSWPFSTTCVSKKHRSKKSVEKSGSSGHRQFSFQTSEHVRAFGARTLAYLGVAQLESGSKTFIKVSTSISPPHKTNPEKVPKHGSGKQKEKAPACLIDQVFPGPARRQFLEAFKQKGCYKWLTGLQCLQGHKTCTKWSEKLQMHLKCGANIGFIFISGARLLSINIRPLQPKNVHHLWVKEPSLFRLCKDLLSSSCRKNHSHEMGMSKSGNGEIWDIPKMAQNQSMMLPLSIP